MKYTHSIQNRDKLSAEHYHSLKHSKSQNNFYNQTAKDFIDKDTNKDKERDKDKKSLLQCQVKKITQMLHQGIENNNEKNSKRKVLVSKLKMGIKRLNFLKKIQKTVPNPKNNRLQEQQQIIMNQKQKNQPSQTSKQLQNQMRKLQSMAIGLQEYQSKNNKNKIQQILTKCKQQSEQMMRQNSISRSFLHPVSQINREIQLVLEQKEANCKKLQQLLSHLGQKQILHETVSLQTSPLKRSDYVNTANTSTKFKKQNRQRAIQNCMKNNLSNRKIKYAYKINQLCHQIKNNEHKINNYFKQFGDGTSAFNSNLDRSSQKLTLYVGDGNWTQSNRQKIKSRNYSTNKITTRQNTQRRQNDNDNNNKIPIDFLKQLKYFYQNQKQIKPCSRTSNCKKRKINNQLSSSSYETDRVLFSDEKLNLISRKCSKNQNLDPKLKKELKICQKVALMYKQRKLKKQIGNISPISVFPLNFVDNSLLSKQSGYNKIIQYF